MCLNNSMNIRDTLTYATIVPTVIGIVSILICSAILAATAFAGVVIFLAEWLHG